jgi:hypothetical protein
MAFSRIDHHIEHDSREDRLRPSRPIRDNESGSVLVLTLLLTLVILGVGITAMWMSSTSTQVSTNLARRQEAMRAAEAGMQRARAIFSTTTLTWNDILRGAPCNLNAATTPLTYKSSPSATPEPYTEVGYLLSDPRVIGGVCTTGTILENVPVAPSTSKIYGDGGVDNSMQFASYTVRVRNDPEEYLYCNKIKDRNDTYFEAVADNGDCNNSGAEDDTDRIMRYFTDENSRVVIRVEGRGRGGQGYVVLEATISGSGAFTARNPYTGAGGEGGGNTNSLTTSGSSIFGP